MSLFTPQIRNALENKVVRGLSRNERRALEHKIRQSRTAAALSVAVLIGVLIAFFHGGNVSTSIAALGAALGLGGVIGFLFGVPSSGRAPINIKADTATVSTGDQSPTQGGDAKAGSPVTAAAPGDPGAPAPAAPGGDGPASEVVSSAAVSSGAAVIPALKPATNEAADAATAAKAADAASTSGDDGSSVTPDHPSNLEQVADWVTKLLLGGGLTQMQRIPPKIWDWAHNVAIGILKERNPDPMLVAATQAFAAGLMVYGFILGFFAGFLITKLQLGKEVWQ